MKEPLDPSVTAFVTMAAQASVAEALRIRGRFSVECRDAGGGLVWAEHFDNVVTTLGKNALFDAGLGGSAYTVTGPFIGLISASSFTTVAAADTMASHAGWLEAGSANAPTFSGGRQLCVWSAGSGGAKALSTPLVFSMTGGGTVQGVFLTFGAGAVATLGSTAGTLFSAGVFATPQPVIAGNIVSVSYSVSV